MKAFQYHTHGEPPALRTVPDPEPGPGQVLLRVDAAGVCHSDEVIMHQPADRLWFPLPLTLGHEAVGTVAALGEGASGVSVGQQVAVYGARGCGTCRSCALGRENYCPHTERLGILSPGLGGPGAIAEYLLVEDTRYLVPLDGLDPVRSAPLTDAGLTPYHAVKRVLHQLVPGSTAVAIGVGGLGHMGIQLLRALSPATQVLALDIAEEKLELARSCGAHHALRSDEHAARAVRALTDGLGADVVLDFVGSDVTLKAAARMVAKEGEVTVVGLGGGRLGMAAGRVPYGVTSSVPYWGTLPELTEVLALARSGVLDVHVETFGLEEAPLAYERLRAGKINGRAVILPNG
ncbi:NAD(P)-dependent alcohol dehydrogenase [Streptomyces sp. NPDC051453]|uniref:NAD(P)-dependent alcohol dehydrogenase n=1 Tax=Streptomyces sp. NPDC051453 TaxID=3154941 RepID=UPI00341B6B6C